MAHEARAVAAELGHVGPRGLGWNRATERLGEREKPGRGFRGAEQVDVMGTDKGEASPEAEGFGKARLA